MDILCHGVAPSGVHSSYIKELEKRFDSKLTSFTVRYKRNKWTPFYIKATFQSGKKYIVPFNGSDYEIAFRNIKKPACTKCAFKGENHMGDLCIGDYWGMNQKQPGWNPKGVSAILVQTEKGNELINMLDDTFSLSEANSDHILQGNPMYMESTKQHIYYEKFVLDLKSRGLHYAVQQLPVPQLTLIQKLKKLIKTVMYKY